MTLFEPSFEALITEPDPMNQEGKAEPEAKEQSSSLKQDVQETVDVIVPNNHEKNEKLNSNRAWTREVSTQTTTTGQML